MLDYWKRQSLFPLHIITTDNYAPANQLASTSERSASAPKIDRSNRRRILARGQSSEGESDPSGLGVYEDYELVD